MRRVLNLCYREALCRVIKPTDSDMTIQKQLKWAVPHFRSELVRRKARDCLPEAFGRISGAQCRRERVETEDKDVHHATAEDLEFTGSMLGEHVRR